MSNTIPEPQANASLSAYAEYVGVPREVLEEEWHITAHEAEVHLPYLSPDQKPIALRRRIVVGDKVAGHTWKLGTKNTHQLIYGLWHLTPNTEAVCIVEGETAAIRGQHEVPHWTWLATPGWQASATGPWWEWLTQWLPEHSDIPIHLWPDNDEPGEDWLREIGIWAHSLREVPQVIREEEKDALDFYRNGPGYGEPVTSFLPRPIPHYVTRKAPKPKYENGWAEENITQANSKLNGEELLRKVGAKHQQGQKWQCFNTEFHRNGDRTGSLHHYKEESRYYCYGCEESGDYLDLYQKIHDIGFYDAMISLIGESDEVTTENSPQGNAPQPPEPNDPTLIYSRHLRGANSKTLFYVYEDHDGMPQYWTNKNKTIQVELLTSLGAGGRVRLRLSEYEHKQIFELRLSNHITKDKLKNILQVPPTTYRENPKLLSAVTDILYFSVQGIVGQNDNRKTRILTIEEFLNKEPGGYYDFGGLILPKGEYTLLTAPQGVGKTWVSWYVAQNALNQGKRVIYFTTEGGLTDRVSSFYKQNPQVGDRFGLVTRDELHHDWHMEAYRFRPDLVILDIYSDIPRPAGLSINDEEAASQFISKLNRVTQGTNAALVTHHPPKRDETDSRGSSKLLDACRAHYRLPKPPAGSGPEHPIDVIMMKDTQYHNQVPAGTTVMALQRENGSLKRVEPTSLNKYQQDEERLLQFIRNNPKSSKRRIREECPGIGQAKADTLLNKLEADGLILKERNEKGSGFLYRVKELQVPTITGKPPNFSV